MKDIYAKILGNHAADLIQRTSDLNPTGIKVVESPPAVASCDLAVRIDFKGAMDSVGDVCGYVVCGFLKQDDSKPLLKALAKYFGFDESLADTADGPINVLSEFLNIIIGLTGADWAEHGFEMDFSTPENISGRPLSAVSENQKAYHVTVATDSAAKLDILTVFEGCETC